LRRLPDDSGGIWFWGTDSGRDRNSLAFFAEQEMAGKIDETQVRQVARLSRLVLTDDEVARFSTELSAIVEYIEKLNALDVDSVEPLAHCLPICNVFRDDEIKPSLDTEQALSNAPRRHDEYFKVPKILDGGSGA